MRVALLEEPSQFFRAGVGIAIVDTRGKFLALKRTDVRDSGWQLPQGGLQPDEEPEAAMWRELKEETGLTPGTCAIAAESEGWFAYELPEQYRNSKTGRGQAHRWYLCRFSGQDRDIAVDGTEFNDWQWLSADHLIALAVPFRRPIYESIIAEFADQLS